MLDLDNELSVDYIARIMAYKRKVAEYAITYAHQAKKELASMAKRGRI